MDAQKEALRRIISTLANKNEELQNFLGTVDRTIIGLQDESCKVTSELELEMEKLSSALEEKGVELREAIVEETQRKKLELQKQLSDGKFALLSCEELLEFANQTLSISNEEEFLKAAKEIKERVTMAPAFRLTTRPAVSESMAKYSVDFSMERSALQRLHFLLVPKAPEIDISSCIVCDNIISFTWQPSNDAACATSRPTECYDVEYQKTDVNGWQKPAGETPWEKICDITDTKVTISGLKFDTCFTVVRVRAKNKMAAGEFSEPVTIETRAYNFSFDATTAHVDLKVQGDTVTWEPQGVKSHDPRLKGKENKSSLRTSRLPPAQQQKCHTISKQDGSNSSWT